MSRPWPFASGTNLALHARLLSTSCGWQGCHPWSGGISVPIARAVARAAGSVTRPWWASRLRSAADPRLSYGAPLHAQGGLTSAATRLGDALGRRALGRAHAARAMSTAQASERAEGGKPAETPPETHAEAVPEWDCTPIFPQTTPGARFLVEDYLNTELGLRPDVISTVLQRWPAMLGDAESLALLRSSATTLRPLGFAHADLAELAIRDARLLLMPYGALADRVAAATRSLRITKREAVSVVVANPWMFLLRTPEEIRERWGPATEILRRAGLRQPDIALVACRSIRVLQLGGPTLQTRLNVLKSHFRLDPELLLKLLVSYSILILSTPKYIDGWAAAVWSVHGPGGRRPSLGRGRRVPEMPTSLFQAARGPSSAEEVAEARAVLAEQLGMDEAEVQKALERNPAVAKRPSTLAGRVAILRHGLAAVELSPADVKRLVLNNPRILHFNFEAHIRPKLDLFINQLKLDPKIVGRLIVASHSLLSASLERRILPNVRTLRSCGLADDEIAHVIRSVPRCVAADVGGHLKLLQGAIESRLGYPLGTAAAVVRRAPTLLLTAKTVADNVERLLAYGLSEVDIRKIFKKVPGLMALSAERNLIPKMDAIRQYGYTPAEIIETGCECLFPALEGRIRPRLELARAAGVLRPPPAPRPALRHILRIAASSFAGFVADVKADAAVLVPRRRRAPARAEGAAPGEKRRRRAKRKPAAMAPAAAEGEGGEPPVGA